MAAVTGLGNTHAWAKAGVMFRNTLAASSPHVTVVVTPGKGIAMQYRSSAGGTTVQTALVPGGAPIYLRLTRTGNTFTGAWSTDAFTWQTIGTVAVPLAPDALAGLPGHQPQHGSHDDGDVPQRQYVALVFHTHRLRRPVD